MLKELNAPLMIHNTLLNMHINGNNIVCLFFSVQLLWTSDLRMSTVHVVDVCRAIWHVALNGQKGDIYNVVDKSETSKYLYKNSISSN